jgi:hypothetical protein
MESMNKKRLLFLLISFAAMDVHSLDLRKNQKVVLLKVAYFNKFFGHIHRNPSRYSQSLSTIGCGHPIKIYKIISKKEKKDIQVFFNRNFYYVKAGPYKGFIHKKYLSKKPPRCFQDLYPRFFDSLELELTDMYHWGKLYDQYVYGRSLVK